MDKEETRELTFGEKAVGLAFNHGEGEIFDHVNSAKAICASAIDMMNVLRTRSNVVEQNDYPLGTSSERAALATIAIRSLQAAQMAMVKAITWKD